MKLFKTSLLLFCSLSLFACSKAPELELKITSVNVFQLPDDENRINRTFNGVAKAHDLVELAFRVDGNIDDLLVSKGQRVKKGELLAILDKNDYQVAVNDRKSKVERTYKQYKRGESMLKQALMAQSEFDKMQAEYLVANADYKMAMLALKYTELRAPFDGIVGDTFIDSFENIQPGVAILSLHRFDLIEIEIQLPDQILATAKANSKENSDFDVVFNAYPEMHFEGTRHEVNLIKDPTTRTYLAIITVPMHPKYKILQGMPAKVTIDLAEMTHISQREFLIPISAVRSVDGKVLKDQSAQVFVYNNETQKVTAKDVQLGTIVDKFIEVKSGLNSGDSVVVSGSSHLVDGQQVSLIKG